MSTTLVPEPPRFLSADVYRDVLAQILRSSSGRAQTLVWLSSAWRSDVRWARNRITMSGDWRNVDAAVLNGAQGDTNQIDNVSLHDMVEWTEKMQQIFGSPYRSQSNADTIGHQLYPWTYIWSDSTYAQSHDTRIDIANRLMAGAESAGMLSAGYLAIDAKSHVLPITAQLLYARQTVAQCSISVRDPAGTASGWAGASSYAWERVDAEQLAATALDKCLRSHNPARIEPGRYTVVLEPQATFGLVEQLWRNRLRTNYWDLFSNIGSDKPFGIPQTKDVTVSKYGNTVRVGTTKIGQRIFDPRINIWFDPRDPDLGGVPWTGQGYPIQPVELVSGGVLTTLNYQPNLGPFQQIQLGVPADPRGKPDTQRFRMDGGNHVTPIAEMLETTERGLLVTRFSGVRLLDEGSVLCSGVTRDGVWLIEHGKITRAVKNLRFTESPIFALNQVEQIGPSIPIFSPEYPAVVPAIKVRDFSFTALEDAV